jgi:hypothetical protein
MVTRAGVAGAALAIALCGLSTAADRPVFRVGVPYPTKDKPQSKLWFAHGAWWAWLPAPDGSSVWKRGAPGWERQTHLDRSLAGLPGQADVWADDVEVRAVLASPDRLAVIALLWDAQARRYEVTGAPAAFSTPEPPGKNEGIETATITRDSRRRWWIGYNWRSDMWVRSSPDGRAWSEPIRVTAAKASEDDLCSVAALPDRVGVLWSDQAHDTVYARWHADRDPPDRWLPAEVVEQGGKNADDHIHAAVTADGALYVATKNSVDTIGKPQLVLRVRDPWGKWSNVPYALRTEKYHPSRPIALLGGDPLRLFLLHSMYRLDHPTPRQSTIAWQSTELPRLNLVPVAAPLLDAVTQLNDVTGCKSRLPAGQPWIVLASDQDGNVYEARLN